MARNHCKSISFFILNEVKDLNSLIISRLKQRYIGKAALARRTYKPIRWVNLASSGIQILEEKVTTAWRASAASLGLGTTLTIPPCPPCANLA